MSAIAVNAPDTTQLLMGNEAIARGALEAGVGVAAAYPGTPSSEIIGTLAEVAKDLNIYVEWSANEKVALEVAAAASFSGVRAISAMKQPGLNVAMDFLCNLSLVGRMTAGLVLVVCDDPGALSSSTEQDCRHEAKALDIPLLEPATFQEAKDMTKWAFEISEEKHNICMIRSVTRISHARGNVVLGELPRAARNKPYFDTSQEALTAIGKVPNCHQALHQSLAKVRDLYESSPFNSYVGPETPELLIITCGTGWLYSREAVKALSLEDSVAILKLGSSWPLPTQWVSKHMRQTSRILVVEEVEPFLEDNLKEMASVLTQGEGWIWHGKGSGDIEPFGEINPDIVTKAIANILNVKPRTARDAGYQDKSREIVGKYVLPRELGYCPGCPFRPAFWAVKDALKLDGRDGVATGDIGCYGMAVHSTGFHQLKNMHAMGSGIGLASGFGKLNQFGFKQPVLAACGDSTFLHAGIPALLNSIHNQADLVLMLMDNGGTAMTGFQPHPGTDTDASGDSAPQIDFENLFRGLGVPVVVTDPFDITDTRQKLLDMLERGGTEVLIFRRECALIAARRGKPPYKVYIDAEKCIGEDCGCNKLCAKAFKCPGLAWDRDVKKVKIDEAICTGCGVCVEICPESAIIREVNQ